MKRLTILLALTALCLTSGCVYRSYQEGSAKYTTLAIGVKQGVAPFSMEAGSPNTASWRKLDSKGLTNSPDAAIVEAAVMAGIKAGK